MISNNKMALLLTVLFFVGVYYQFTAIFFVVVIIALGLVIFRETTIHPAVSIFLASVIAFIGLLMFIVITKVFAHDVVTETVINVKSFSDDTLSIHYTIGNDENVRSEILTNNNYYHEKAEFLENGTCYLQKITNTLGNLELKSTKVDCH
jgi:glucan phosphoethanolaminetransferase (alkaline phosphatase superfamily)